MVLKRKRSDSEISSASSLFSSPLSSHLHPLDQFQSYSHQIATPALFASRTRKRTRDNRPSEAEVHQHTLSLLFSAQQKPNTESRPSSTFPSHNTISAVPSSRQTSQQSSLHAFWALPSSTRQSSPASIFSISSADDSIAASANTLLEASACEDCGTSFANDDSSAMDIDMMDVDIDDSHACTNCRKQVCHSCSVSNLGAERRCLNCAGR